MKMTLDETWKNCLSMWRWIAKEVRGGREYSSGMKIEWLGAHGLKGTQGPNHCFFCSYRDNNEYESDPNAVCPGCPGSFVDKSFDCMGNDYPYDEPLKFYNKLVSLNRKRLKPRNQKKLK